MTVLYGEWNPNWQTANGVNNSVIAARDADMGHRLDVIHWYADNGEDWNYDKLMVVGALALGRIPFVSWSLMPSGLNTAYIAQWAQGMASFGSEIWVRLFWEFNDPGGPSSTEDWSCCPGPFTSAQLVSAYRQIVGIFRSNGATNVRFVWNPDGTMGSQMYGNSCGSLGAAYPGDAYVSFRGFDSYGYDNATQAAAEDAQTGSRQPMVLGEIGDNDSHGGAAWVNSMSSWLNGGANVHAVVWFNESEWVLAGATKTAVKTMLQTPAFQAGVPAPSTSEIIISSVDS